MKHPHTISGTFGDLILKVWKREGSWRASVEVTGDQESYLSDGTCYPDMERAQRAAVFMAKELFGTGVNEEDVCWEEDTGC